MIDQLRQKIVAITPPGAIVDDASWTTASIDTKGWDYCTVVVLFGAMDIAMAALKLQSSDTDGSYADITNGNFASGTQPDGTASSLPSATSDNTMFAIHVDCKKNKRYLDLVATGGDGTAGTYAVAFAILSRGREVPNTKAERGYAQELFV